jgi:hypothetical protein
VSVKQTPMLFKDRLVRAILDGTKTQTRRPVKGKSPFPLPVVEYARDGMPIWWSAPPSDLIRKSDYYDHGTPCPYGHVGDLIWVRETWAPDDDLESYWGGIEDFPGDARTWESMKFRSTASDFELKTTRWRPSIHMPKWACRIWLEITDVRVERIASISDADCLAEGIESYEGRWGDGTDRGSFAHAWEDVYPGSWERNDWVWAIDFKRTEAPA